MSAGLHRIVNRLATPDPHTLNVSEQIAVSGWRCFGSPEEIPGKPRAAPQLGVRVGFSRFRSVVARFTFFQPKFELPETTRSVCTKLRSGFDFWSLPDHARPRAPSLSPESMRSIICNSTFSVLSTLKFWKSLHAKSDNGGRFAMTHPKIQP